MYRMKNTVLLLIMCGLLLSCGNQGDGSGSSIWKRGRKAGKISLDTQWRGPDRSGVYADRDLLTEWPERGPDLLFTTNGLGKTYSSAVATEDAIFTTGLMNSEEYLSALDLDGNILWQKAYGEGWDMSFPDARCTPLIEEDRVYVLSAKDNLVCFNADTGAVVWEIDLQTSYFSEWDMFGVSESLLLIDDKIICTPCGQETTVLALDKMTGELVWKSEALGIPRSNGSPVHVKNEELGLDLIIAMNQTHVLGVDAQNGEIYWSHRYNILNENNENVTILANTPVVKGDEIFISNGWDVASEMLKLGEGGRSVSVKYSNDTLDNQNHGLVHLGEYVYGSNFLERNFGKWVCMRWEDGKIMYETDWNNKGPIISADGMLYLMDETKGNVGLAKASPDSLHVVSSFRVKKGRGPFWARPSIYNGMLLIRHGEYLLAYDLTKQPAS